MTKAAVLTALAAALAAGIAGCAHAPTGGREQQPSLIVLISVDQLRAEYLERYRSEWTGGFARLLEGGAVFTSAYQDHSLTQTAPGHATLATGRTPSSHGMIRNDEGVGDPAAPLVEAEGAGASPRRLRGSALFDWLATRDTASRALAVSRKDRGSIPLVGRARQHVYWYSRGRFTTSTYYRDSLPDWVREYNAGRLQQLASRNVWDLLLPAEHYAEPDSQPWERNGSDFLFPHRRPESVASGDRSLEVSPWVDEATLGLALTGMRRLRIGLGPATDLLAIGLSATDDIGHAFGPNSREIHDHLLRLDRVLGAFFDTLFAECDARRVVVALSADHGVTPMPEWARAHGNTEARRVPFDSVVRSFQERLTARLGPGSWVRQRGAGLLVLEREQMSRLGVDADSIGASFRTEIRRLPWVLRVDDRASLLAADTATDDVARRWLHTLPPELEPAALVTLRPGNVFLGTRLTARHEQPSEDDTHVPLLLMGPGVRRGRYATRVSTTDLAPSLAALAGVRPTETVNGRVLVEALQATVSERVTGPAPTAARGVRPQF